MMHRKWINLALLSLVVSPATAFALPGEAASVLAHCGTPVSDYKTVSPVTGLTERNITYGNLILHFQAEAGGWSYMSAWDGHLPASQAKVTQAMPCFGDALTDVAKTTAASGADPTLLADQTQTTPGIHFGAAFLWLLAGLGLVLLVTVALPGTRRRLRKRLPMDARPYRKPGIGRFAARRRPAISTMAQPQKPNVPRETL